MDVRLVRWPIARHRLDEFRAAGVPRLVIVEGDCSPPRPPDELEDWVRMPADQSDVRMRVDTLADRARHRVGPELADEGLRWRGGKPVLLSPVERRIMATLIDRFRAVVGRNELTSAVWPGEPPPRNALDVQIWRLRRRLTGTGLAITTVRSRGYMLDVAKESGEQMEAKG